MRRAVLTTRQAISPRLAMRTLSNMGLFLTDAARSLHSEKSEFCRTDRSVERRRERKAEHPPTLRRIDDAVVPETGGSVIRTSLAFVLLADRPTERLFVVDTPDPIVRFDSLAADGGKNTRGLLAAHHGNAAVRPYPEKARRIGAPAHAIIARPERTA